MAKDKRIPGSRQGAVKMTEAQIDENIIGSFPASDPPCWTLGRGPEELKKDPERRQIMAFAIKEEKEIQQIREKIGGLCEELRAKSEDIHTPQGQALLETSAEVLTGVGKAFDHFLSKSEEAWKRDVE